MIKVGNIYEITQMWLELKGNEIFPKLMPEFKDGALFEVIEVENFCGIGQATAVKCLETGKVTFIEQSPVSAYTWCFFSQIEAKRGYIILKGSTK